MDMTSFNTFANAALSAAESYWASFGELAKRAVSANPMRRTCEIPPPCWLPRSLGEARSFVCAGGSATIQVRVTNCQNETSSIQVAFAPGESQGSVTPAATSLGPMERKKFIASFPAPADAAAGQQFEILLWVRGCTEHYLRWTIEVSKLASDTCCHEIEVRDCADHVHHWYDHFYCERRCSHTRLQNAGTQMSA